MNEEYLQRQTEHVCDHLWNRHSFTFNQFVRATIKLQPDHLQSLVL